MARNLDVKTLNGFSSYLAAHWNLPGRKGPSGKRFVAGREMVLQDLQNLTFKDEFEFVTKGKGGIRDYIGGKSLTEFETAIGGFKPRSDSTFQKLLRERLAVDVNGDHIEGAVGTVQVGVRPIRQKMFEVETLESIRRRKALIRQGLATGIHDMDRTDRETIHRLGLYKWPVYAGEAEERAAGRVSPVGQPGADELPFDAFPTGPDGRMGRGVGANVPTFSAEAAVAALDAVVDRLDEGTTAATIRGRTGTQPADPDATETGTLLFTLTMSDPAFNNAADDGDGTCSATADTITDDSSADATGTLGYCRAGATGTGADDHIDGEAGTSSADFIFNTLAIASGAVISMSSFVVNLSQGSTAS